MFKHLFPGRKINVNLLNDNNGAINLCHHPTSHGKTKWYDMKTKLMRDTLESGMMTLKYVPSEENIADLMTKALAPTPFIKLREKIGLTDKDIDTEVCKAN